VKENPSQIEIKDSKIIAVRPQRESMTGKQNETVLNFTHVISFPGLINSHDHLEFNLFPQMRNKTYNDYVEWGNDIHEKNREQIENVLKVPYNIRFKWGLYKNLICGITTVVHHGNGKVIRYNNLPNILINYNYLHSIRLEKKWKLKLNSSFNSNPFVVHIGEGINRESHSEIDELISWNILKKKVIGVHGISLDEKQCGKFLALVWCPDSNLYLYNKTADISFLKKHTVILFGTDSALSADWNLWNQLRLARGFNFLNDIELYKSMTENASDIWRIKSRGLIAENRAADIVISKKKSLDEWDSFYNTNPEDILLILKNEKIVLIDEDLSKEYRLIDKIDFDLISINSVNKFIIKGIGELVKSVHQFLPYYSFPFTIV
jgi:hypothetical protein